MDHSLYALFVWTQLTTAERISIYNQWKPLVTRHNLPQALAHIERALAHDEHTQELEIQWEKSNGTGFYHPKAAALDPSVDDLLGAIYRIADATIRGFPASHPAVAAAKRLIQAMFPLGLAQVVNAPFVQEAAEVGRILRKLRGERAADVALLHLDEHVDLLEQLGGEYRAAVDSSPEQVAHADVRAAQQRGLSYLAEIAVLVLARFYDSDNPAHVESREEFLAPVEDYDARGRALRSEKRRGNRNDDQGQDDAGDADTQAGDDAGDADTPAGDDAGAGSDDDASTPSTSGDDAGADEGAPAEDQGQAEDQDQVDADS